MWISLSVLILFSACTKNANPPKNQDTGLNNQLKLGEADFGNLHLKIYTPTELFSGYNELNFIVTDASGNNLGSVDLEIFPEMKMDMMSHGAPVEQPVYDNEKKWYRSAAIFTMPAEKGWNIRVKLNGEEKSFPISVSAETPQKLTGMYKGTDGINYQISIIPQSWKIGMNDFEVLIHDGSNHYVPVNDLQIHFYPEMVSMNHSSPNNTDPMITSNGHYKGQVNFTMTGLWRLHFQLIKTDTVVEDGYLEVMF